MPLRRFPEGSRTRSRICQGRVVPRKGRVPSRPGLLGGRPGRHVDIVIQRPGGTNDLRLGIDRGRGGAGTITEPGYSLCVRCISSLNLRIRLGYLAVGGVSGRERGGEDHVHPVGSAVSGQADYIQGSAARDGVSRCLLGYSVVGADVEAGGRGVSVEVKIEHICTIVIQCVGCRELGASPL